MIVSLVAAASDNNVIGVNGNLPWKMPADMKFFKNLTMGHAIIMGRKTYDSMGRPLPGRKNIIISRKKDLNIEGCTVFSSFTEAINSFTEEKEVFIIGGAEIYSQALPRADKIYLTRVHCVLNGDAYFPQLIDNEWIELKHVDFPADEKNPFSYSFIELVRKNY